MILRRIARPMLASIFITSGIDSLRNPAPKADVARDFIDGSVAVLPDSATSNVPTDAETLVRVNAAIQVGGGVLLATGKFPRFAATALAGSLVPTTLAGHPFWNEADPAARAQQRTQFFKNLSILGGLLITAADTEGKPSLAWRGRRKADAVVAALPVGAKAGSSAWDSLRERTHEGAEVLGERSTEAGEYLSERGAEAAAKVREHAPELAEAARERGAEAAAKVREHAPELAEAARERGAGIAEKAALLSAEVAERAADVADRIRDRAPVYAEAARERSAELADAARHRAPELAEAARERSAELADTARQRAPEFAESARSFASSAGDAASKKADAGRRRWRKARS